MINYDSIPLLIYCLEKKINSVVNYLLENNVNVNAKNRKGETALHAAIQSNNNFVNQLLSYPQIDVNCADINGATPFFLAISLGKKDVLNLLKQKRPFIEGLVKLGDKKSTFFTCFLTKGNRPAINLLLEEKGDPYYGRPSGLVKAIYSRDLSLVKQIIEIYGPPVADDEGHEPLVEAALRSSTEILKLLLESCKSDINKVDKLGINPLLAALYSGSQEKIDVLKKEGALLPILPLQEQSFLKTIIYKLYLSNNVEQLAIIRNSAKTCIDFEIFIWKAFKRELLVLDYLSSHGLLHPQKFEEEPEI